MRGFHVTLLVLCLFCGTYLLVHAPVFFLPDRYTPAQGWQFSPLAARALGGGLLAIAAMALIFLRHHYYSLERRLPGPVVQKVYFALVLLALGLISLSLHLAEPITRVTPPPRVAAPDA
jgi:hypothetical protein